MFSWKSFKAAYQTFLGTWLWMLIALLAGLVVALIVLYFVHSRREKRLRRQKLYAEIAAQQDEKC